MNLTSVEIFILNEAALARRTDSPVIEFIYNNYHYATNAITIPTIPSALLCNTIVN